MMLNLWSDIIELKSPTPVQINNIINQIIPAIDNSIKPNIVSFIQGDLRKLTTIYELYKNKQDILDWWDPCKKEKFLQARSQKN